MSTMIMSSVPQRKPVGSRAPAGPSYPMQAQPKPPPMQHNYYNNVNGQDLSHSRTRTNSSSVMPYLENQQAPHPAQRGSPNISPAYSMTSQQYPDPSSRRTLSNATSSTSSTNNANPQTAPRRSTSSRSASSMSPTSYVALMRKQKATVWCDRAQHEDPRILVAQRQAKMRAAAEVAGGHSYATSASRTSTSSTGMVGGVRSKIRHHGAPKASAYNAAPTLGAAGVPMRLSATEVDEENDSDEEGGGGRYNATGKSGGSARNSIGSGRARNSGYSGGGGKIGRNGSNNSTPSGGGGSPNGSFNDIVEEETPMARSENGDYFLSTNSGSATMTSRTTTGISSGRERRNSNDSVQDEKDFGSVPALPKKAETAEEAVARQAKNAEDLRRRGSVDERTSTMTMGAGRLFIANPDYD
ncbi:unnamed protein product [Zymoseptoria tritici ST99CH_1A5]|uniref:Uncharacterized protein n=4 Tax=Zymoseptoria tritici TaxID=1047171 RepID=F9XH70_ZYMTI|nr:uncharacterized protein MYCGRDRAFT_110399 [Zymoseptoria tritici IPO323]SMQ53244.1 unnamed protein product [Zymoseptoria tritici ST99CH_3D7]SMR56825.1 unnamed protein product [Zymoseptoria tritici ST99CH_1E4]SMR59684.1 unnamed protein product [Zymoseptoria tritici ST99CH_3D1]SMY26873.1 unnamed protein product [Zymoseptoria tritici ST99CH_1A5]EGP84956.1 hypothetical protein MYCGRDRAFT_110399 [Zymoseptoria tritici IPO323]